MNGLARAAAIEGSSWRALWRWATRAPRVPEGSSEHSWHGGTKLVLGVFIVLSAIEIPIVDLIVHPWPWVRIPLLALGVWGLLFMLGMAAGQTTRPHAVGPEGIIVRGGFDRELVLPWSDIAAVSARRWGAPDGKGLQRPEPGVVALPVGQETHVELVLEPGVALELGDGEHTTERLRIAVDDVPGFLAAVRRDIP
ncbi:PH domain-containing protein [Agrococcus baldri]|uniref:Low molecular weight protein antigen 6 PH domain-containing protein n=1 Tax=Agrococcus baldri TaxID=153730 RepID=A0AA87RLQ2_9MICO|nr:PH domain-containing protein [Agrococcus baldri]GEK80442.1 hypothetical protein ABA31_17930 [Agrococcus baldri]